MQRKESVGVWNERKKKLLLLWKQGKSAAFGFVWVDSLQVAGWEVMERSNACEGSD